MSYTIMIFCSRVNGCLIVTPHVGVLSATARIRADPSVIALFQVVRSFAIVPLRTPTLRQPGREHSLRNGCGGAGILRARRVGRLRAALAAPVCPSVLQPAA